MAFATAASIDRKLVSSSTASAAGTKGAVERELSRSSRGADVGEDLIVADPAAPRLQLVVAALGANGGGGADEQLGGGVGCDDGADVAPVEDRTAVL